MIYFLSVKCKQADINLFCFTHQELALSKTFAGSALEKSKSEVVVDGK